MTMTHTVKIVESLCADVEDEVPDEDQDGPRLESKSQPKVLKRERRDASPAFAEPNDES
jgi:hypothetical protein